MPEILPFSFRILSRTNAVRAFAFLACILCIFTLPAYAANSTPDTTTTFYCVQPLPEGQYAYDLSVVSPTSIWYTTPEGVFRSDGKLSKQMLPRTAFAEGQLEVLGVEALSDSEVWVLGHNVRNWNKSVYRYNGTKWQSIPFPQASADTNEDLVVWRFSMFHTANGTRGYAVGQEGVMYAYDGTRWKELPRFTSQYLRSLTVVGVNDVWAGGKGNTLFHFDGNRWTQSPTDDPKSGNTVLDINVVNATDIWAVGTRQILHFDGSLWHTVPSPVSTMLRNIRMISSSDGWIISHDGELLRYNGASWKVVDSLTNRVKSTIDGMQYVHTAEDSALYILGTNGINRSHRGKLPTFTDVTFFTNIHTEIAGALVADIDRNGTMDLLGFGALSQIPDRLYSNRGDGTFTETTERVHTIYDKFASGGVVADFDNNGYPDILLMKFPNQDMIYRNHGDWTFSAEPAPLKPEESSYRENVQYADMDNDGSLDLVYLTNRLSDTLTHLVIWYNDGVGRFTRSQSVAVPISSGGITTSMSLADFDNDGSMDVFIPQADSRSRLFLNEGCTFRDATNGSGVDGSDLGPVPYVNAGIPVDINNDGFMDLMLVNRHGPSVFYINNGHAIFKRGQSINYPVRLDPVVCFEDIDCDGQMDMLYEDRFYHNENGTYVDYSAETGFLKFGWPLMADIDQDGDPDLLIHSEGRMFVYRNGFNPTNIAVVNLKGIRSNSQAIGAQIWLWKTTDGHRSLASYRQLSSPVPLRYALQPDCNYDLEVRFPSGQTVLQSGLVPGNRTVVEFSPLPAVLLDAAYSIRRSYLYADLRLEAVKGVFMLAYLVVGFWLARRLKIQRLLFHPVVVTTFVLVYFIVIHATIRYGMVISVFSSVGGMALVGAFGFVATRRIHDKRSATIISHYRLMEMLGEGGMGKVFKAFDLNAKQQKLPVAIKLLNPHLLSDPENNKRLRTEGQLLSSFTHPNILRVFEIGESEGRTYIAMEYLSGGTLKEHIQRSYPMAPEEFRRITLAIAGALKEVHAKNIIHRDIKSINLMFDAEGNPKLMDFGLSKSPLVTMMTTLGTVIGTLGYVAPEQITNVQVDHRSDIFSFGVVMYEMLTNTLPFKGENEMAVIHALFNTAPVPPSAINLAIPAWLDSLVLSCLEKDPSRRCSDVGEIATILNASTSAPVS